MGVWVSLASQSPDPPVLLGSGAGYEADAFVRRSCSSSSRSLAGSGGHVVGVALLLGSALSSASKHVTDLARVSFRFLVPLRVLWCFSRWLDRCAVPEFEY